jgi:hypothetical protein
MQIAELVLKYLDSLIYPILIFSTIIIFKKQLAVILSGDLRAKYKDLELTIERSRKTVENIKDGQEVAIYKMKQSIDKLECSPTQTTELNDLRLLIESIETSLEYWENEVMNMLRKKSGRCSEQKLLDDYLEVYNDFWSRQHEVKAIQDAIQVLLTKSIIARDNGDLVLHNLLM